MASRRESYAWFMATRVKPQVWTGPVVRLADLTATERAALYARAGVTPPPRPSEVKSWLCVNPHCRQWTMNAAWKWGRCNFCGTPRPTG